MSTRVRHIYCLLCTGWSDSKGHWWRRSIFWENWVVFFILSMKNLKIPSRCKRFQEKNGIFSSKFWKISNFWQTMCVMWIYFSVKPMFLIFWLTCIWQCFLAKHDYKYNTINCVYFFPFFQFPFSSRFPFDRGVTLFRQIGSLWSSSVIIETFVNSSKSYFTTAFTITCIFFIFSFELLISNIRLLTNAVWRQELHHSASLRDN